MIQATLKIVCRNMSIRARLDCYPNGYFQVYSLPHHLEKLRTVIAKIFFLVRLEPGVWSMARLCPRSGVHIRQHSCVVVQGMWGWSWIGYQHTSGPRTLVQLHLTPCSWHEMAAVEQENRDRLKLYAHIHETDTPAYNDKPHWGIEADCSRIRVD